MTVTINFVIAFHITNVVSAHVSMKSVLCYAILLVGLTLGPGGAVLTINATDNTQPSESVPLQPFVFITCQIEANFMVNGSTVVSQWILPNGTIIPVNDDDNNRYEIFQGMGPGGYESVLLIQPIIYSDAVTYSCQVRDIRDPDNIGPWITDQANLILRVELITDESEVTTFDNATEVSMSCEMSLYLHPDENLQWYRGGEVIAADTERHTITYTNGNALGQFGDDFVGPSRVSTLVISQPQMSDSDTYTCAIINTQHSQDIQLIVESVRPNPSTVLPNSTSDDLMSSSVSITSSNPTSSPTESDTIPISPTNANSSKTTSLQLLIVIAATCSVLGFMIALLCVLSVFIIRRLHDKKVTMASNAAYGVTQQDSNNAHQELHILDTPSGTVGQLSDMASSQIDPVYESIEEKEQSPTISATDCDSTHTGSETGSFTQINCAYGALQDKTAEHSVIHDESTSEVVVWIKDQGEYDGGSDDGSFTQINSAYGVNLTENT